MCICLVIKLSLTLCNPMDCSLPGSSAHGISRARILEWVAIPFSQGSNLGLLRCRQIVYHQPPGFVLFHYSVAIIFSVILREVENVKHMHFLLEKIQPFNKCLLCLHCAGHSIGTISLATGWI